MSNFTLPKINFNNIQIPDSNTKTIKSTKSTTPPKAPPQKLPTPDIQHELCKLRELHPKGITNVMVFDTETSALKDGHILQMSYILYNITTNTIVKTVDRIIRIDASVVISEGSYNVHHIDFAKCQRSGVPIVDALKEFYTDYVEHTDMIIGHNIKYDTNMMNLEMRRNWKALQETHPHALNLFTIGFYTEYNKSVLCTMNTTKMYYADQRYHEGKQFYYWKSPKLVELHERLYPTVSKAQRENLHNSLMDCLVTLQCYVKLWHMTEVKDSDYDKIVTSVKKSIY